MAPQVDPVARPGDGAARMDAIRPPVETSGPTAQRIDPSLTATARAQVAFADVLHRVRATDAGGIQFSSHAQRRLQSRSIPFGQEELHRLQEAVDKADSKGSRDSLILIDELALVVSIRNRVVITAIDKESRQDNIFTNIDSVVMT